MVGAGKAAAAETRSLHPEVAPVFLNHQVCCDLGDTKKAVLRLIDGHGFVDAAIIRMALLKFPASFQFPQWQAVWRVSVYLVCRGKDERRFRTVLADRL